MARYQQWLSTWKDRGLLEKVRPIEPKNLAEIERALPPAGYLDFLNEVGYGSLGKANLQIYNGFLSAKEAVGRDIPESDDLLIFSDDFAGTSFLFRKSKMGPVFSIDSEIMEISEEGDDFQSFITQYLNNLIK